MSMRRPPSRLRLHLRLLAAASALWCGLATAAAQEPGAPALSQPADREGDRENRLLREGTRLVEAMGTVRRDAENDRFIFRTVTSATGRGESHSELILLPSVRLAEIERVMQSMGVDQASFEVTGRVYLYLGRNYLLPQLALQRSGAAAAVETDEAADEPPAADAPGDTAESRRRETDRIIRGLEESLEDIPTIQRDGTAANAEATTATAAYREGQMIVQRRGRPVMDAGGQWRFVFDSDATGFADPPVQLLPCRLLERLQRLGQRDPSERAVRITGEVFTYDGRAYLMPLSYHEADDRSRLDG